MPTVIRDVFPRRLSVTSCLVTLHGFSSLTNLPLSASNTLIRTITPARRSSTFCACTIFRSAVGRYRIQLPAGASASIPSQERDFGRSFGDEEHGPGGSGAPSREGEAERGNGHGQRSHADPRCRRR